MQTLPASPAGRGVAQENAYTSIRKFGVEAGREEATAITFGLVQYLDALARGDWPLACARLYSVLRGSVERQLGADCPAGALGELMSRAPERILIEQSKIDVSSVRQDGERAFVIYRTPDSLSVDMPMYREDGIWKVGALEAYAL